LEWLLEKEQRELAPGKAPFAVSIIY
jgi:hypothetical protein